MAVIKKTLFAKNLDKYAVLVNDTQPDSKYFKISELPDTFTGGKNAFLIAGSEYLVPDTKIQIELKDSAGNVIYHEPGEGVISSSINGESFVAEYYEGVSKVVAVYVYPDTAYGPCTLTILGELNQYVDGNGFTTPVSLDWENKYNVKWQKQINVNPSLANTTKIRFYQRPMVTISELLSPLYRIENDLKVASNVTQSFANIKLSKLETFAGDVKRVKVFRTSQGDISDYDLIQDILVESKELLTSYGLSGSVVGETGILTSETLKNYWKTGSLNAFLTSSRVESGVRLTGSGNFTYSSSLDIKSANTYELNLDAFYSSSTSSNLGIYLSYVSQSTTFTSSVATLVGTQPTKNLLDTVIPFKIDRDYPSASLYFSQSQGEWHLGNISLKLSQDTAFSPDEISFVTTMPTVLGGETFNFKFEFYDVNNNYVPVEVTQSALFTGGNNNLNGTLTLISSSTSASLDIITKVSSSISGTMTVYSSSASSSVGSLSGSVSSSLSALSSSVSSSNSFILSSSLSKVQQLANGKYSGSFIGDTFIYSPTIGGQQGYISELFKVGNTTPIVLDARKSVRKIYVGGVNDTGSYNSGSTPVYMDSDGKFSLGNQLSWSGNALTVNGTINVTGGNAATDENALLYSGRAAASASISASAAQSNAISTAASDASAKANAAYNNATAQLQLLADGGYSGSFIGSTTIYSPNIGGQNGYISNILRVGQGGITLDGGNKKIYVGGDGTTGYYNNANTPFYFASGSSNIFSLGNKLTWDGNTLGVSGTITAGNGSIGGLTIAPTKIYIGTGTWANSNTGFYVDNGGFFSLKNKLVWDTNNLSVTGEVTADSGQIGGWTIGGNKIYKTNKLELDAGATYPAINVYGSDGVPRVIINNSPTLSSLTGGGAGSGTYAQTNGGNSTNGTIKYFSPIDMPTVNTAVYNLSIVFTESDSTDACNFSPNTSTGNINWGISIWNTALSTEGQSVYSDITNTVYSDTFWSWSDLGGINGIAAYANVTGDGTTLKIRPFMRYNGSASSCRDLTFPQFTYSWVQNVSKTEIIPGGMQVVNSTAAYLKADRNVTDTPGTPWMESAGNWKHNGTLITTSDRNIKSNIIPIDFNLEKLNEIDGYSYDKTIDYDEDGNGDVVIPTYGIIAQEIETILPNAVSTNASDGIKGVDYNAVTGMLLSAVKKLYLKVVELENRISGSI